jgi:hypothetical protein
MHVCVCFHSDADDDDVDDDGNSKAKSSSSAKAPESRVKRQKKLAAAPNPAGNGGIVGSVIDAFARRLRKFFIVILNGLLLM